MRITEEDVLTAADQWAAKNGESHVQVKATALELMSAYKTSLSGDKYMEELEKLYRQYRAS